jgi:hypothetical protein
MFKISDEDIMSFVKESLGKQMKERGLIPEQEGEQQVQIDTGCDKVPVYPKLNIDKLVGKRQPTDVDTRQFRQILERVNSSIQGNDVKSRIRSLNNVLRSIIKGNTSGMEIDQLLSRFIFLDSFLTLLDRSAYEPQMAGLLLEPLMAAVLKGEQLGGPEVISDFEIPNLEDGTVGVSLKLKSDSMVEGSFAFFVRGLVQYGRIAFYHIQKFSGEKDNLVTGIKVSYYEVKKPNWLEPQITNAMIEYLMRDAEAGDQFSQEELNNMKSDLEAELKYDRNTLLGYLDDFLKVGGTGNTGTDSRDENTRRLTVGADSRDELLSKLSSYSRFQDLGVRADNFKVNFNINNITQSTNLGAVKLPTREELRETAKKSIESLNSQVSGLYKNIGMLSCVMKNYTAGENITREEFAEAAKKYADEIVKTANIIEKGQ